MFRIMIVEDEPPIQRSIREKIKKADPDFKIVGEYENGEVALFELNLVKPHVLLTDIQMPIMNGIQLIEQVKKIYPDIICAILSGYQDFEYARQAIRLGVSDYLLKPPTAETIQPFLSSIKNQLMNNQELIESELVQLWILPQMERQPLPTEMTLLSQEYFYHATYLLIYAWYPAELEGSLSFMPQLTVEHELIRDGEKLYSTPSLTSNEWIGLAGIHAFSEERMLQWLAVLRSSHAADSISFTLARVETKLSDIHLLVARLRKTAQYANRIGQPSTTVIKHNDSLPYSSRIILPQDDMHHLITFMEKQKNRDFLTQLELLLHKENLGKATRVQWVKTLNFVLQSLVAASIPSCPLDSIPFMEREIEEAVWQAQDHSDLVRRLKDIFSQLLSSNDPDIQNQWVKEMEPYLQIHYMTNITLSDLAERFNLNPSYLSRIFKREKGK